MRTTSVSSVIWFVALIEGYLAAVVAGQPATTRASGVTVTNLWVGRAIAVPENAKETDDTPQYGSGGTMIRLRVFRPEGDIAGLDTRACRLNIASDDKGVNLLRETIPGFNKDWPSQQTTWPWSDDRHGLDFEFWFPGKPADDATKITLEGDLVIQSGTELKTELLQEQVGEDGFKQIHIGPSEFRAWSSHTEKKLNIFVSSPPRAPIGAITSVDKVAFLDAHGSKLQAALTGGSSRVEHGLLIEDSRQWTIEQAPEFVQMQVTYFQKLKRVKLPFHVEVARPKVPPGPYETRVPIGIGGCSIELSYDKQALTEFGISPAQVDVQLKEWFETHAKFSVSDLGQILVKRADGEERSLRDLAGYEVKFSKQ